MEHNFLCLHLFLHFRYHLQYFLFFHLLHLTKLQLLQYLLLEPLLIKVFQLLERLKLAELEAAHQRGEVPLFLLDDLTSELDEGRRTRLIEILRALEGQVWVTTTDPAYLGDLSGVDSLKLRVQDGCVVTGR